MSFNWNQSFLNDANFEIAGLTQESYSGFIYSVLQIHRGEELTEIKAQHEILL